MFDNVTPDQAKLLISALELLVNHLDEEDHRSHGEDEDVRTDIVQCQHMIALLKAR